MRSGSRSPVARCSHTCLLSESKLSKSLGSCRLSRMPSRRSETGDGRTDKISDAQVQTPAPSDSSAFEPAKRGSQASPGTEKTFRFSLLAQAAVDKAPDRSGACTTTTASASAAINRLRRRKRPRCGAAPAGAALIRPPPAATRSSKRLLFSGGYGRSMPVARTAQLGPETPSAPWWAAVSMPRAPPDTMATPWQARSAARSCANSSAGADAARVPTIATA